MIPLTTLPTELLRLILSSLADIDLLSFFTARRTCRTFQAVITDILDISIANHGLVIHAFLKSHFSPVLDSSTAGSQYQPSCMQPYAPFAALPWSFEPEKREKWLRMEASWRRIPLASASGSLVHKLQEVKLDQNFAPNSISYITGGYVHFQLMAEEGKEYVNFPNGVRLGLLYDMMNESPGCGYVEWKLLEETRVRDDQEFGRFCVALCDADAPNTSKEEVMKLLTNERHCALMVIGVSTWWTHYEGPERDVWQPEKLGEDDYCIHSFRRHRRAE